MGFKDFFAPKISDKKMAEVKKDSLNDFEENQEKAIIDTSKKLNLVLLVQVGLQVHIFRL